MKVTLIPAGTTIDPERHVGEMAAICYNSDTSDRACRTRAKHCNDSGHLATLRFAHATFSVTGISRVCSHQIVRMAHAGILQRSQRYVKETDVSFIDPPALVTLPEELRAQWRTIQEAAATMYLQLVDNKLMLKEDARYILPQGCETGLNLCLNFQGWRDFLKNRLHQKAQWEVRAVAESIRSQLHAIAPNIFP